MAYSPLFTCKINPQKPFHIYDSKKFSKQPFLIVHPETETLPPNPISHGFSLDDDHMNTDDYATKFYSTSAINTIPSNGFLNCPLQIKQIPEASYLQNLTLQFSLLKQQNPNKYFINCNGNSSSNLGNDPNLLPFNQYAGNFFFQEKEKMISNLTIPENVLKKMSSNCQNNSKLLEKTSRNYKNVSKSPDFRKGFLRKNSKKEGNLSMDDNKSIDDFLSDEEEKENKPIFDLKHLPSPNSRKIINYDDLKIYNEEDECLELEDERNSVKSYTSKDFLL